MVFDYGFTKSNTPPISIQEFYREQGEVRLKKQILDKLIEEQKFQVKVTLSDTVSLSYIIHLIENQF
jgi:hypothetical protein